MSIDHVNPVLLFHALRLKTISVLLWRGNLASVLFLLPPTAVCFLFKIYLLIIFFIHLQVLIMFKELGIKSDGDVVGFIHRIAGLSYVIDPFVYVFLRKSCRQKMVKVLRQCICKKNSVDVEM